MKTVVGLYDDIDDARAAVNDLVGLRVVPAPVPTDPLADKALPPPPGAFPAVRAAPRSAP